MKRGKKTVNKLGFPSWAGRRLNPLWIVVRNFGAEMEEKTHYRVENHLADPTDVAPLRWVAMTLLPKNFPAV